MFSPPLARLIAKLFARPQSRRDRRRAARLGVERLEGRDVPAVTFTVEDLSDASEDGDIGEFRVTANGDTSDFTSTVYAVVVSLGGTATSGTDYSTSQAVNSYMTFNSPGATATFTVTAVDDGDYEGDETVELSVRRYQMFPTGPTYSDSLTLHDNDPQPAVSVERLADAVEGGSTGTFRVSRTGPTGSSLAVGYTMETTGDGCATAGTDYTSLSGSVTIAANATYADVTVTAATDAAVEGDERVSVTVQAPTGYIADWAETATLVIVDKTAEVSVVGMGDVEEGEDDGIFRFTRTGDTTDPLTVTYSVVIDGPSMADDGGSDYTTLSGTVTFAANSATADVLVVTVNDNYLEPDEEVSIVIDESEEDYTIGWAHGSVWITDGGVDGDGRDVIWISDDDGTWDDPANWDINDVPEPDDNVYFLEEAGLGNMLGFGALEGLQSYASVRVLGYTSTITLDLPLSVGTLEMKGGGVIDQPYGSSSEISVTTRFVWTMGIINNSGVDSALTLSGASGLIEPVSEGTLSLGSTLNISSGTLATIVGGTLEFIGGLGMIVTEAVVEQSASDNTDVAFRPGNLQVSPQILLVGDSIYSITRAVTSREGRLRLETPIVMQGGDLNIAPDISFEVSRPAQMGAGPSIQILDASSQIRLSAGDQLRVPNGLIMTAGTVQLNVSTTGARADIIGHVVIDGGTITGFGDAVRGSLRVVGNVDWYSGEFSTNYHPTIAADCFTWVTTGTMTVGNDARVKAFKLPAGNPAANTTWLLMQAAQFSGARVSSPNGILPAATMTSVWAAAPGYDTAVSMTNWYLIKQ